MQEGVSLRRLLAAASTIFMGVLLIVGLLVGAAFGCKAYGRYQKRADANNRVRISAIEIRNQAQRIKVTEQQAQIRYRRSVGIREAQDEIAKTLTPLYVQFEMVEALKAVATSGKNNSTVFIPVGANGIPLISGANGPRVGLPAGGG